MCFFNTIKSGGGSPAPAITPTIKQTASLPTAQPLIKEGETAKVAYGGTRKESGQASAGREGTAASLKIKLNKPGPDVSKTGGFTA